MAVNQNPSQQSVQNSQQIVDNTDKLKESLKEVLFLQRDFAEEAKKAAKAVFESNIQAAATYKSFKDLSNATKDISVSYADIITGQKTLRELQKDIEKQDKARKSLLIETQQALHKIGATPEQINEALSKQGGIYDYLYNTTNKIKNEQFDLLALHQEQLDALDGQSKDLSEIQKQAKVINDAFGTLGNTVEGIEKGLNKAGFGNLTSRLGLSEAVKKTREYAAEITKGGTEAAKIGGKFKIAGELAKNVGGNLIKSFDPVSLAIIGLVKLFQFIKDAMFAADERVTSIAKNLSISKDAAADVYSNLTNLKGSLDTVYGTTTNIVEAFNQVSTATGFIGVATKDQIETQIILTKNLGLQVEEANQLQGLFAANNTEASKGVDIVYDQVAAFARENKLLASGAQTLKEIQNTSKLILVNFRGNIPALTNAILEAKKLGLSLDQVNKVAGSLLNFEESISAELEAELLLGKDINLERARLFALNNDIAGVTKEIATQGITIESFSRMNRIQQEAIAKTLGMQAEELGKALYDAKVIEKLGGRDLEVKREAAKRAREIAEATGDEKKIAEAMNEEARIAAIEKGILTGKALEDAEKSVSIQETFNKLLERAQEIFSDVFTEKRLDKFADGLERFIKAIESGRSLTSIFLFGLDSKEEKLERYKKLETKRYEDSYSFQEHQKLYYNKPKNIMSKTALINNENIKVTKSGQMYSEEDIMGFAAMQKGNREMAEQKELINTINKLNQQLEKGITANAYLDSNKVGTAQNMATTKT